MRSLDQRKKLFEDRTNTVLREVMAYLDDKKQEAEQTTLFEIRTLADHLTSDYQDLITRSEVMDALDVITFE